MKDYSSQRRQSWGVGGRDPQIFGLGDRGGRGLGVIKY